MVNTLIDLKGLTRSIKALVYGIEWLIVDKFVDDEKTKNILRDLLCDRMSFLLRHGMRAEVVAKSAEVPLSKVKAIERKMKK